MRKGNLFKIVNNLYLLSENFKKDAGLSLGYEISTKKYLDCVIKGLHSRDAKILQIKS